MLLAYTSAQSSTRYASETLRILANRVSLNSPFRFDSLCGQELFYSTSIIFNAYRVNVHSISTTDSITTHCGISLFSEKEISVDPLLLKSIERHLLMSVLPFSRNEFETVNPENTYFVLNGNSLARGSRGYTELIALILQKSAMTITRSHDEIIVVFSTLAGGKAEFHTITRLQTVSGMDKYELDLQTENSLRSLITPAQEQYRSLIAPAQEPHRNRTGTAQEPHRNRTGTAQEPYPSDSTLTGAQIDGVIPVTVTHAIKPLISSLYFIRTEGKVSLLRTSSHFKESVANLFINSPAPSDSICLAVTHHQYGDRKRSFDVPLGAINTFFQDGGLPFIGFEHESADTLQATVMYFNSFYNVIHILVAKIPRTIFDQPSPAIDVELYSNIPCDNVQNLFASYHDNKTRKIMLK